LQSSVIIRSVLVWPMLLLAGCATMVQLPATCGRNCGPPVITVENQPVPYDTVTPLEVTSTAPQNVTMKFKSPNVDSCTAVLLNATDTQQGVQSLHLQIFDNGGNPYYDLSTSQAPDSKNQVNATLTILNNGVPQPNTFEILICPNPGPDTLTATAVNFGGQQTSMTVKYTCPKCKYYPGGGWAGGEGSGGTSGTSGSSSTQRSSGYFVEVTPPTNQGLGAGPSSPNGSVTTKIGQGSTPNARTVVFTETSTKKTYAGSFNLGGLQIVGTIGGVQFSPDSKYAVIETATSAASSAQQASFELIDLTTAFSSASNAAHSFPVYERQGQSQPWVVPRAFLSPDSTLALFIQAPIGDNQYSIDWELFDLQPANGWENPVVGGPVTANYTSAQVTNYTPPAKQQVEVTFSQGSPVFWNIP